MVGLDYMIFLVIILAVFCIDWQISLLIFSILFLFKFPILSVIIITVIFFLVRKST